MIIVRMTGGLGNQMFQYAAGRCLAARHRVPLKLDLSAFRHDSWRGFALASFAISAEVATPVEIDRLAFCPRSAWRRCLDRALRKDPERAPTYVAERQFAFDPEIASRGAELYMDGYWQSEKYFADCRDLIRREFRCDLPPNEANARLALEIAAVPAVSVHVRRGDYASDDAVRVIHGLCDLEYYRRCAAQIRVQDPGVRFYVFSDEPDWVRTHLQLPGDTVVVDRNGPDAAYEDLRLMRLCRHHVIANSSFSWWGAWLREDRTGLVFAPQNWFADRRFDTTDLLPAGWQREAGEVRR